VGDTPSILEVFRQDNWRLGDVSVIPYDRTKTSVFGDHYLYHLYQQCLLSKPKTPGGVLSQLFCGVVDLSCDAICAYLSTKKIILLCVHTSPTEFTPAGFAWITQHITSPKANAAFGAMVIFRPYYGTPESTVLGMLGLAYFFTEFKLRTILGQRLVTNVLAKKWLERYGARDIGVIPDLLLTPDGGLADCAVSALRRVDFEKYVTEQIRTLVGNTTECTKEGPSTL
jgi:hypothetical protein